MATSNPKVQLEVGINADGIEADINSASNKAKAAFGNMAQALKVEADKAAAAFDSISAAAQKNGTTLAQELRKRRDLNKEQAAAILEYAEALKKAEKEERSFVAQVKRANDAVVARVKGYEELAKQKGLGEIAQAEARALDLQNAALTRGTRQLDQFGNTAKQTAAALRQVPAQFTDIVVSLQGGQAPLTVLLQQGGQLKDVFGSAGAAAQALGGYIASLINPLTLAALGIGSLAVAYQQGSKEAEAFNKTLILTGNAAGTSAAALSDIARSISATSEGITQGKAAAALNEIASAGAIGTQNLERFTKAALEFERAGGGAAAEVGKAFADLAKDPLDASEKLNKSTNFLTAEIYNQIKALEDQERSSEAAKVAQEAYFAMLEDRTPKLNTNLGLLERGWRGVTESASKAWDAMLDVGRAQTLGSRLDAARTLLAEYEATPAGKRTTEQVSRVQSAGGVEGLRNQILGLEDLIAVQRRSDEQQRQNNQSTQAAIGLSKDAAKYDSDLAKQRKAVAQATEQYQKAIAAGNLSPEAAKQAEADYLKIVTGLTAATKERTTATRGLSDAEKRLREERKISADVVKTRNELVEKSYKDQIKFEQDLAKSIAATVTEREKETAKVQDQVQRELDVAAAIGLTKEQVAELAAAKYEDVAAGLERQAIDEELLGYSARLVEETRKQAKAFRELAEAKRTTGRKQAEFDADKEATKQAEAATKDWMRAAADIEKSITDALFRAFESGKGFVQALRDTIVNAFKTMVLRPIVQAIVSPVAGAITGALGVPGAANAATSGASMLGGLGNLGGIGSAIGGFGTAASYGAQALFAGNGIGAIGGGLNMIGAGSFAQGAGMVAGVLGPVIAGVTLLSSLIKATKSPGEQALGGFASTRGLEATFENARRITPSDAAARDLIKREDAGLKSFAQTTVDSVLAAANNRAEALGLNIALGIDAGFAANLNGKGKNKNAFGYAQVFANDTLVAEFQDRELGPDLAKASAAFTQKLQDAVATALLEGSGIESKEFVQFDQTTGQFTSRVETAGQTLDRLANSLTSVNTAFDALGLSLYDASLNGADAASTFVDLVGGLDQFQNLTRSYYENFYTEGERAAFAMRQISAEFAALGQTLPGTREEFRALVESARAAGDNTLLANLLKLAPAFASVNASVTNLLTGLQNAANQFNLQAGNTTQLALAQAQQAAAFSALVTQLPGIVENGFTETQIQQYLVNAQNSGEFQAILGEAGIALATNYLNAVNNVNALRNAGTGSTTTPDFTFDSGISDAAELARQKWQAAFDALSRAVDVQRELAQQQLEDATAVYELSRESARALRGEVEATRQQTAQEGLRFIDQALTTLRTTGYLPEEQGLREAIDAARGGVDSRAYTSAFEQDRDRLVLAGKLQQLADLAEPQKTAAEQQLEYLDTLVETAQSQLDALLGNNTAILTLTEAVTKWQQAIAGTTVGSPSTGANAMLSDFIAKWQEAVNLMTRPFFPSTEVQGFASGGWHTGGLRIVGERGPELEVTGPARIYSAEQTKEMLGGGTELINEVRALREDNMAQSRSIAQLQTRVARVLERWDGNGLPQERVEV